MSHQKVVGVPTKEHEVEVGFDSRPALIRIRLWDLPTRVFHWSLVLAVSVAVVTGELGGVWMEWHGRAGLVIVGLVAFRIVWGFVGSTHARFLSFAPTPSKVVGYLRGRWQGVGHNPLGAFSVFALLGVLAIQAATGLFTNDDIAFTGPLNGLIDETLAAKLTGWHRQLANGLLILLALHIVAIFFYVRIKKDNIVKPMVTGWKDVPSGASASQGGLGAFVLALGLALGAVCVASGALFKKPGTAPVSASVVNTPPTSGPPATKPAGTNAGW